MIKGNEKGYYYTWVKISSLDYLNSRASLNEVKSFDPNYWYEIFVRELKVEDNSEMQLNKINNNNVITTG